MTKWISAKHKLPDIETPVLAFAPDKYDAPFVGAIYWETCNPMIEPYFKDFKYWDDYHNGGQDLEDSVTHWMLMPEPPEVDN